MKRSNPDCNRGIGLVAYRRDWFSEQRYCSKHCRDAFAVDAPNLLKRFVVSLVAFVGLIVPVTFTTAVLAAPPARQVASHLPGCDRNLADASGSVAAMQTRIKSLSGVDRSEICTATRLFFRSGKGTRGDRTVQKRYRTRTRSRPLRRRCRAR